MKIEVNHIKRIMVKLPELGSCGRGWKPPLVMLSIALLLILSPFLIQEVYAQATVTYYFNGYDPAQAWTTDPANMIDNDEANHAGTDWINASDETQLLNSNTCPGTNLGTITKVEMRALIDVFNDASGDGYLYITPVFAAGDGTARLFQNVYSSWTSWFDITSDPNAPPSWTWADVVNLDTKVRGVDPASHDESCWKVEIRVTYLGATPLTFNRKYVVTSSTPVTGASTTIADDTQASQTFSLAASRTVLVIYNAFNNNGSTEIATGKRIGINVDGADYARTWNSPYAADGANGATTFWIGTLAAGSHTITGRFASNTNGSTVTIDERVLLIVIFDGDSFRYIDNATAQTTTSATLVNDPSATQAFTAPAACKALILYNVGNGPGSTEDQNGKYAAINLGGTDYSQLIKSPNLTDRLDNVFTLHYAALTAGSYTAQGRFASRFAGATVTISRRQLGVLLFADSTLADYVSSDTSVNTTSLYPVNDDQALISRTTTDTRELLVVASATEDYQTSSRPGVTYGIQVDGNERTKSRTSPRNIAQNSNNTSTAYAETLAAESHTVRARYGNNTGSTAVYVTSRRVVALWLQLPATQVYYAVGQSTTNDLRTGTPTCQVSGTTITFSTAQTDNRFGVGCKVTYGSSNVCYISGKISSTVWSCTNATGGTPTAAGAGTTVNSIYHAFASLNAAVGGASPGAAGASYLSTNNLVTGNYVLNIPCYYDTGADGTVVTITAWTTGANNYINIYTPNNTSTECNQSQRHSGKWDTGKYQLVAAYDYHGVIWISDEYVRVTGLQIENTRPKGNRPAGIEISPGLATSDIRLSHNILRSTGTGTGDWWCAAIVQPNTGGVLKAWNNIMYNWGAGIFSEYTSSSTVTLYNNTIVNSDNVGIDLGGHASGNYRLANNLVQGAATNYYFAAGVTLDYSATNLSQDATSPQVALRNKTVLFAGAADFHLASSDTNAKDQGTNLSSDANLAFSDDIDGHSRGFGSAWDIGADEYVDGKFEYRRQITIDRTRVSPCSSNPLNFPILIKESGNWVKTKATDSVNGRIYSSSGYDIVFRADDGVTQLDHEIEKYDGTIGILVAWVRIPSLNYSGQSQDTSIYIYYGNAGITSPTANPTGVWNSNYMGVWHLADTSGNTRDSTSYNSNGTLSGTITRGATGKINGAFDFSTNGWVNWGDPVDGHFDFGTGSFTVSAWINIEGPVGAGNTPQIIYKNNGYRTVGYGLEYDDDSNNLYFIIGDGIYPPDYGYPSPAANFVDGETNYIVGVVDRANNRIRIYKNGVEQETGTNITGVGSVTNAIDLSVTANGSWGFTNGTIDEVRISNTARDACWIGTEYNNQSNPSAFISLGTEGAAGPTAVKLTSFTATEYSEGVLLKWKTGYEVNNLGFHLYREENGQLVRLTPEPVAGSALMAGSRTALTAGHHYHWWDTSAIADVQGPLTLKDRPLASRTVPQVAGLEDRKSFASSEALLERSAPQAERSSDGVISTVRYWLKDIDLNGTHTMHGPVTPVFSREPIPDKQRPEFLSERGMKLRERYGHYWKVQELKERLALKRLEVRGAPRGRGLRSTPFEVKASNLKARWAGPQGNSVPDPRTQQFLAGKPAVKLFVREDGWYRVSQPELVAAGLSSKVNPKYLQLYADGREQPIRIIGKRDGVFGPGDAIEFYGTGLDTPSTDTRVYWVVEGPRLGKRIYEVKGYSGSLGSLSSSSFPYTVQVKDRWIYLPAIKNGEEENFFGAVVYGSGVDQLLGVNHLGLASSEDALLEVVLQGATNVSHRVKVLLNNEEVGEVAFEGQSKGLLQVEVPQSLLLKGDNLVSFVPLGGDMDISLVHSIRLTYWHTYTADDNGLRLAAQGGNHLTVNGFSHPKIRVLDITDSNEVIEVFGKVESQKGSYAVSFRVPGTEQRTLLALTEERVKSPEGIDSNHPSAWHQVKDGYDLVIVTYRDFLDTLQPLRKLRESQGLKVALIDVEDLYDEFCFGNKSPKAIKDFLTFAKAKWHKSPRFVLLVGDASFDPKNYFGLGDFDFVPTKLVDTVYMETASDDWFVDLNSDGLPEMAIGRLPVQTAEEATVVVSKIVGYEKSGKKNEALLVADRVDDSDDFNFEGASEEVRALLPTYLMVRKIYRSQFSSDSQANGTLLSAINQGPLLVNFVGHGSIEIWRGIFSSEDAENLINKGLPFFVNMTCLNGYFQDPYSETLGEALLKAKGGGAIAVWTSSGLTEPDKQAVMNKELIKLIFGREPITLGEATAKAKKAVSDQDIRKTWILFGDPSQRLGR